MKIIQALILSYFFLSHNEVILSNPRRKLPKQKLQPPSFFERISPDYFLSIIDWRAKDDYNQIMMKIKNSRENEPIDEVMSYIHQIYLLDLHNRCIVSQIKAMDRPGSLDFATQNRILCSEDLNDSASCKKEAIATLVGVCEELVHYARENITISPKIFELDYLSNFYKVQFQKNKIQFMREEIFPEYEAAYEFFIDNLIADIKEQVENNDRSNYVGFLRMKDFYPYFWREVILDMFDNQMNPIKM